MNITLVSDLTEKDKAKAIEDLIFHSSPRQDFFLMVILSVLMATYWLLLDSPTVIIGSMLIAPILFPILGLSMGIVMVDSKLIGRSVKTILKSMFFAILSATIVTLFYNSPDNWLTNEVMVRMEVSLAYVAISFIAGLAGSFALINPKLNESLPWIAISVALIPPLGVIGIGVATLNWLVINKALLLFLINIAGILFASLLVFTLMNFYVRRKVAQVTIAKDEKEIEENKVKAEEAKSKKQKVIVETKISGKDSIASKYHLEVDAESWKQKKEEEKFVVNTLDS